MSFILEHSNLFSGLICGFLFGFVLESAGLGSACKLTAQFRMSDWSVFKVMFSAIVVAAAGIWGLELAGVLDASGFYVPPAYLGAIAIGGAIIGAGFAMGGYCPGTAVVATFLGRLDAVVFAVGLFVGSAIFAVFFDDLEFLLTLGDIGDQATLMAYFGIQAWQVLTGMVLALVAIFYFGGKIERAFGGPMKSSDVCCRFEKE